MYSRIMVTIGVVLILAAGVAGGGEGSKAERKPIYQVDGKGMERVEAALVRAGRDNKRVLLKIGGNWCGWCYKLHDVLNQEKAVASLLRAEYELVMIDSQADKAVIEKWGIRPKGYPYLAVLDAPWCGWCVRMDKFLARPEIAKILEKDYVVAKIDLTRMTGAEAVVAKIRKPGEGGGIPWFAFVDESGEILITSTKPGGGNIGFPVDPEKEIPHFVAMLKQTRAKISEADIEYLRAALIKADPRPRDQG